MSKPVEPFLESPLAKTLTLHKLRGLAGGRSYERGVAYAAEGRVSALAVNGATVTAKVRGNEAYFVRLRVDKNGFDFACTCPVGREEDFCKHCVAVGLVYLKTPVEKAGKAETGLKDVRAHLAGQDKDALVDLLMRRAGEDGRLRQRLVLEAAKTRSKGVDFAAYRRAVDAAVSADGLGDPDEDYEYVDGVQEAVDGISGLLKAGHADEAVELAEYALKKVESVMEQVYDEGTGVSGLLEELQEIHLKACRKAKPDPRELARRLFDWELNGSWDVFRGSSKTYAAVLGETGLAAFQASADSVWAEVPALGPGDREQERYGQRFRITAIMESLARARRDVDGLVAVMSRDLSDAHDFLEIAELCRAEGRPDLALEWAEKGIKAFPKGADSRLRRFLADEYLRRRRKDEALALIWANFKDHPELSSYRSLKQYANKGSDWGVWREKALALLRSKVAAKAAGERNDWARILESSTLVSVFLWERDTDEAWRQAESAGCTDDLWLELAAKRGVKYPGDAYPVYQRSIEFALNRKNNDAYRTAVGMLKKVRELMDRAGRGHEFEPYLTALKATHKPKRNFIRMLDAYRKGK